MNKNTNTNTTRREFVVVAGAFAAGWACSAPRDAVRDEPAARTAAEAEADEEEELNRELRRLATEAPIEELVAKRLLLAYQVSSVVPDDPILWHGMRRLCDEVLANPSFPDRRLFARVLVQIAEGMQTPLAAPLRAQSSRLREVR